MRSKAVSVGALAVVGLTGLGLATACSSTSPGVDNVEAVEHVDTTDTNETLETLETANSTVETADGSVTTDAPATVPATGDGPPITNPPESDPVTTAAAPAADGPIGVGDELFPDLGSPLIDVTHYDIDLSYDSAAVIRATVTLDIDAVADIDVFTLDAIGLDVSSVQIDGDDVEFDTEDPELIIEPEAPIDAGQSFAVAVTYSVEPGNSNVSPGSVAGWFITDDGSFTLNEPDGARSWLPSNDHPSDKATYTFTLSVPAGETAVANGLLQSHTTNGDTEMWVWDSPSPMSTYLIQVLTGHFDIVEGQGPNGLIMVHAIQEGDQQRMQPFLDVTLDQIDFLDDYFGPFPFENYGVAMTDGVIGGAMEEQTRSLFSRADFADGELGYYQQLLLAHELAHQWFGDAVTPAEWQDIWLNESFATYAQWMWLEHVGFETVEETAAVNLAQRQDGTIATGTPDRRGLFGYEVYDGGAVILHALRLQVGDEAFFQILQTWAGDNLGESRTSADFIELVETATGQDQTEFFDAWLYAEDLPDEFPG